MVCAIVYTICNDSSFNRQNFVTWKGEAQELCFTRSAVFARTAELRPPGVKAIFH